MIKNIIFDLGGVIIDLSFDKMTTRFEELGFHDFKQYFSAKQQNITFEALELGKISSEQFYESIRQISGEQLKDEEIEEAWNLILNPFVAERMKFLEKVASKFQIYLFSNTNAIHAKKFEEACLDQFGKPLCSYFSDLYYSHLLHQRKPNPEAFEAVLKQANIKAEETLFVDDNWENIQGAKLVGLRTHHLLNEDLCSIDLIKLMQ